MTTKVDEMTNLSAATLEGLARKDIEPGVDVGREDLSLVATEAWEVLLSANEPPSLFRFGALPVRIETTDDGSPILRPVTADRLRYALARCARWYTRRRGREVAAFPPMPVVRDMLARPEAPLPILGRIVHAPVFAGDGTLAMQLGYSARSRTFYFSPVAEPIPEVAAKPTAKAIGDAAYLLGAELLGDFPFVGRAESAHALALALLPFLRELIDGPTPLHLIEKPSPGTGASLLAEAALYAALGRAVSAMTEGREEDEWRKRLTARLVNGPSAILIDNLRGRLESSSLSAAITATTWEDRLLGHTETVRVPVRTCWVATGNNPTLSSEIARRTVRIRLDARTDRPWLRDGFRHPDLRRWMAEHRPRLAWAALTLGQAWIAAGRPLGDRIIGGFEDWARVVGGVLAVAGVDGFLENLPEFYDEADAEGAAWRAFVGAWWERHADRAVGVAELWSIVNPADARDGDPIDLGLGDGSERSQRTRLGKALTAARDRQFNDVRVVAAGTKQRAQLFRLVEVQK